MYIIEWSRMKRLWKKWSQSDFIFDENYTIP